MSNDKTKQSKIKAFTEDLQYIQQHYTKDIAHIVEYVMQIIGGDALIELIETYKRRTGNQKMTAKHQSETEHFNANLQYIEAHCNDVIGSMIHHLRESIESGGSAFLSENGSFLRLWAYDECEGKQEQSEFINQQ